MSDTNIRFTIPQQIASEHYDNEVLAINLDNGTYYSLTGEGPLLWSLIQKVGTIDSISEAFLEKSSGNNAKSILGAIYNFLLRLISEGLITVENSAALEVLSEVSSAPQNTVSECGLPNFELQIYTDMQDLLLLDPIHDVESEGWPVARSSNSNFG